MIIAYRTSKGSENTQQRVGCDHSSYTPSAIAIRFRLVVGYTPCMVALWFFAAPVEVTGPLLAIVDPSSEF